LDNKGFDFVDARCNFEDYCKKKNINTAPYFVAEFRDLEF